MLNFASPFSLGLDPFENWWLSDDTSTVSGSGEILAAGEGTLFTGLRVSGGTADILVTALGEGVLFTGLQVSGGTTSIPILGEGNLFVGVNVSGEGQLTLMGDGGIFLGNGLLGTGEVIIEGSGGLVLVSSASGIGELVITGEGGITFVPQIDGIGVFDLRIDGNGGIVLVPELTGSGVLDLTTDGTGGIFLGNVIAGSGVIDASVAGSGGIVQIPYANGAGELAAQIDGNGNILLGIAAIGSGNIDLALVGEGTLTQIPYVDGTGSLVAQVNGTGNILLGIAAIGSGNIDLILAGEGTLVQIPYVAGTGAIAIGISGQGTLVQIPYVAGTGSILARIAGDGSTGIFTGFQAVTGATTLDVTLSGDGLIYRGLKLIDTAVSIPVTTNLPEIAVGHYANGMEQPPLPIEVQVCNSPLNSQLPSPFTGLLVNIIQDIPPGEVPAIPLVVELPPYVGTTVVVPLPDNTPSPTSITIAGITYTLYGGEVVISGGVPVIPPRTFIYNPVGSGLSPTPGIPSISIALPPGNLPPPEALVVIPPQTFLPTNYLSPPYPDLFYRFPVKGQFSWTLSFEGHPSASFNFVTYAQYRDLAMAQLSEGTEFTVFGIGYRVNGLSFKETMASNSPQRLLEVNVSLGGRHEVWVDRQVRLRGGEMQSSESVSGIDPNCLLLNNSSGQGSSQGLASETSLGAIANSARGAYCGPGLAVKIPRDTPTTAMTTFSSEFTSRLRITGNGCFANYNNPGCVEAIGINSVPQHFLSEGRLLSDIQTTLAGSMGPRTFSGGGSFHPHPDGSIIPAVPIPAPVPTANAENTQLYKWAKLYDPPYKLEWGDTSDSGDEAKKEDTQLSDEYTVPRWKRKARVKSITEEGDDAVNAPPANSGFIKDISVCFDLSGPRKTYKKTTTLDGLPLEDYVEEWGFVVYGWQIYAAGMLTGADSAPLWQQIRSSTTKYIYDPDTGYQLGYDTDGWELSRYKQESATKPETIELGGDTTTGSEEFNLYIFFRNPVRVQQRNYLEPMRDYYKDIEINTQTNYKVCLPGGRSEWRFAVDPMFVEPYIVLFETMHSNSLAWIRNPLTGGEGGPLPPLTCGKEEFHRRSLLILTSKNTQFPKGFRSPGLFSALGAKSFHQESPDTLNSKEDDKYREYMAKFSSQDSQFVNSLQDTTFSLKEGRPPIGTKLPPLWEKVESEAKNGGDDKVAAQKEKNTFDHFVFSGIDDYYGNKRDLEGGSLSYPHAKNLGQALVGVRTEATIENWNGGTKENFSVPFSTTYRPGDRLIYACNYSSRQRRILSISNTVNIDGFGGSVVLTVPNAATQLSVGLDRPFPMDTFRKVRVPEKGQKEEKVITSRVFSGSYPLGEIIGDGVITRRNLP